MAAPFSLDIASPPDDGVVSQFPANERTFRDEVDQWLKTDHSATTGNHFQVTLDDPGSDPTFASAKLGLYHRSGVLKIKLANGTAKQIPQFTTGSGGDKTVFVQAAAPTGWTQDTTHNDRVLRFVDAAGAGTGGNWTLSGMSVDSTVLTTDQIPSHTHGYLDRGAGPAAAGPGIPTAGASDFSRTTNATGGGLGHTHGLTNTSWRPAYVDAIICYMTT